MTDLTISQDLIQKLVDKTVEEFVSTALTNLQQDPVWVAKIENMINQTVVTKTIAQISSMDVNSVIQEQVNQTLDKLKNDIIDKNLTMGIQGAASQVELTILDDHVVVENTLSAKNIQAINTASIKNLSVTGTINVDNSSWNELADNVSLKTLDLIGQTWKTQLAEQVAESIASKGIDFSDITVDGEYIVKNQKLSSGITESNLTTLGLLKELTVLGEAQICDTVNVTKKRVGINTQTPEMALSVWDEDVSVIVGRLKENTAYVGTGRNQNLSIGVNRTPAIDIDVDGLTTVKRLRVGVHSIGHGTSLPGYAGTRGDIVFNSNINSSTDVFAWICLGAYNWKELKTA